MVEYHNNCELAYKVSIRHEGDKLPQGSLYVWEGSSLGYASHPSLDLSKASNAPWACYKFEQGSCLGDLWFYWSIHAIFYSRSSLILIRSNPLHIFAFVFPKELYCLVRVVSIWRRRTMLIVLTKIPTHVKSIVFSRYLLVINSFEKHPNSKWKRITLEKPLSSLLQYRYGHKNTNIPFAIILEETFPSYSISHL